MEDFKRVRLTTPCTVERFLAFNAHPSTCFVKRRRHYPRKCWRILSTYHEVKITVRFLHKGCNRTPVKKGATYRPYISMYGPYMDLILSIYGSYMFCHPHMGHIRIHICSHIWLIYGWLKTLSYMDHMVHIWHLFFTGCRQPQQSKHSDFCCVPDGNKRWDYANIENFGRFVGSSLKTIFWLEPKPCSLQELACLWRAWRWRRNKLPLTWTDASIFSGLGYFHQANKQKKEALMDFFGLN